MIVDPRAAELTWLDLNDPNPPVGEDRLYPGGTVTRPADREARP